MHGGATVVLRFATGESNLGWGMFGDGDTKRSIWVGRWLTWPALFLPVIGCDGCRNPPAGQGDASGSKTGFSAELIERHNRAVALMGHFDYAGAYDQLEPLVAEDPDWSDAQVDLAIAALNRRQTGDSERAMTWLREVIAADPKNLRAYLLSGNT